MKYRNGAGLGLSLWLGIASSGLASERTISLMQLSDLHGNLAPHPAVMADGSIDAEAGGMARIATLVSRVRSDSPASLLLLVGDATHGSAETMFTLGDAIMPALNALDIDVFLPGNWDFGWGPRVYRQRFTADTATALSANNRTTLAWMDGRAGHEDQTCNRPGGPVPYRDCHVTKANFPTVANNLYYYDEALRREGERVHDPYIIRDVGGVKLAIIGITSDSVPHQAQAFNTGFRFTMGFDELPRDIAAARADGAELIVVLSELGLSKNVQLVHEFPAIDVMFSGHTHERTQEAIVIEHDDGSFSLVTEAGEDDALGRLDITLAEQSDDIVAWRWSLMEAGNDVPEDPAIKKLVDRERETFLSGPDFQCHTFGPNAFPFGKGHTLCEPLDRIVGRTEPTLQRFNALEAIVNNANVDAFLSFAQFVDADLNDGNTLSTTNGFRFDVTIPGSGDGFSGDITIGDLYTYYPIGAAVALAQFSGGRPIDHWEDILANVFDPNPYRQRGGWFLGLTRNIRFDLQLDNAAKLPLDGGRRIERVTIDDGGGPRDMDRSRIYTLASCYPHGNPIDEVCRTSGAFNTRFIAGTRETDGPADLFGNRQLDMGRDSDAFSIRAPENSESVFDPARSQPLVKVAPDNFVHPVDALRWYLRDSVITRDAHGLGRVRVTGASPDDPRRGVPESEFGGPGLVQPTQGAGPDWLTRGRRVTP